MKIIYSDRILPKGFDIVNLFGVLIVRKNFGEVSESLINHEQIHTRQMIELLFIPFYIIYVAEWLIRLIQYKDRLEAYYNISFEREAYQNMENMTYLKNRRPYSFIGYFKKP